MRGQATFFEGIAPLIVSQPIRLVELFAGIGSQAKALENLGARFEHYRVCEFDGNAIASYNAVHGTTFQASDITQLHARDLGITETDRFTYIMTYSFPCQDLSNAGLGKWMKKGSGTRSGLLWEVERLLNEMDELPQILLMENVPAIVNKNNVQDFADWCGTLEKLGYKSKWAVLNARDYGIPQNRERCFMASWQGPYYFEFPEPVPLRTALLDMLDDDVPEDFYVTGERLERLLRMMRGSPGDWVNIRQATEAGYIKCKIGGVANLSYPDSDTHRGRVCEDGDICPTISTKSGNLFRIEASCDGNLVRIRKLTPKEFWRLMGFSDTDFEAAAKVNSKEQLYHQAGNSIVVDVLMAIFREMLCVEKAA